MEEEKEWFEEWFDTTYYHKLYSDRNFDEAEAFIKVLSKHMNLSPNSYILDLACGKGRHALQLNQLGYKVKGVDLSANSIQGASKNCNENLEFSVADMREPLNEKFDAVYNLFTSFGYFNSTKENLKVLNAISIMLKPGGKFVIDFMNCDKVIANINPQETLRKEGIDFHISKKIENDQIIKSIEFNDKNESFKFEERVQALTKNDFEKLISQTDLKIEETFGDYLLSPFDNKQSDRLIIIGSKQ